MATKASSDRYSNAAFASVTLSAANTLTFSLISMGVGIFQRAGMILHRISWMPSVATIQEMAAANDALTFALTSTNRITTIGDPTDPAQISVMRLVGHGVNVEPTLQPFVQDFTMLPGGGRLLVPNPLYIAGYSVNFANPAVIRAQLDFTFVELTDADYLELVQSQYPANVS